MTFTSPSFFRSALSLLVAAVTISINVSAQESRFAGIWVTSKDIKIPDENTSGVVTVGSKGTTWNIFNNQLFFDFGNMMKGDTLVLLYRSCDCSKPYKNSNVKFPKQHSAFAKCYLISEKEMGVIYTNKAFIASLKKYVLGTRSEKEAIFPPVLYLNNHKPVKNTHVLKTE